MSTLRLKKSYIVDELHSYNLLLDNREIFLHGNTDSEEDCGVDHRMANNFLKNIRLLENDKNAPIIIHQHNVGGNWDDGMVIFDSIATSSCYIAILMHGCACSMGSIIPQAADLRIIMPNCSFMVHDGTTDVDASLTYKAAQSLSEVEKLSRNKMMEIYCNKCLSGQFFQNKNEQYVRKFINTKLNQKEDWWFNAEEAVNYGFADYVLGSKNYENIINMRNTING